SRGWSGPARRGRRSRSPRRAPRSARCDAPWRVWPPPVRAVGSAELRRFGGLAHPPLRDLFKFARFSERFDRPRHTRRERRFFGQQGAPFFAFGLAELA